MYVYVNAINKILKKSIKENIKKENIFNMNENKNINLM